MSGIRFYFCWAFPPALLAKNYYRDSLKNKTKPAFAIFLRTPKPGRVKTRLAKDTGKDIAALTYRLCANNIIRECSGLSRDICKYIFFDDINDFKLIKNWAGKQFVYVEQDPGTLGQRLEHAISTMLSHGHEKVLVLASDTPDLSSNIILNAITLLNNNDVIVGPSCDGGYYLIGMKKMYYQLFRDIPWSTGKVLQETLARASEMGLSIGMLPELIDIDTIEDLRAYINGSHNELSRSLQTLLPQNDQSKLI